MFLACCTNHDTCPKIDASFVVSVLIAVYLFLWWEINVGRAAGIGTGAVSLINHLARRCLNSTVCRVLFWRGDRNLSLSSCGRFINETGYRQRVVRYCDIQRMMCDDTPLKSTYPKICNNQHKE